MRTLLIATASLLAIAASSASADDPDRIRARLTGSQEVPFVSTPASGRLVATVAADGNIDYELSYSGLQADATQAHIHIGQRGINGGIVLWLCSSATNPAPAGVVVLTCPTRAGTVTGILKPADVRNVTTQGFATNDLAEVVGAIRAGVAYANVHTSASPGGEIRGQLRVRGMRKEDERDGHDGDHKH
jgi:hypothetical protein